MSLPRLKVEQRIFRSLTDEQLRAIISYKPKSVSQKRVRFWSPTSVYDPQAASTKFTEQFRLACRISNRAFQLLVRPEYGVRWIDTVELYGNEASLGRELVGGKDLYPQQEVHREPAWNRG